MALKPGQPVPSFDLESVGSARFSLSVQRPERFTMLVFYRGLHCPGCRRYLTELDRLSSEFAVRGVDVFAASADTRERAEQTRAEWGLTNLALGYGLSLEQARAWGLYVSNSRGKTSAGIEERRSSPSLACF